MEIAFRPHHGNGGDFTLYRGRIDAFESSGGLCARFVELLDAVEKFQEARGVEHNHSAWLELANTARQVREEIGGGE